MDINNILQRASGLRICVVGDLIADRYIFGDVDRISPEGPVPIIRVTHTRENPGGAGNVVENLKGLGTNVSFFHQENIPIKTRVMSQGHHLIRIDDEDTPIWMNWDDYDIGLGYGIENKKFDCVVISDYSKGAISEQVAAEIIGRCVCNDIPVVVDSKYNLDYFQEASLVKCNRKEWDRFIEEIKIEDASSPPATYISRYLVDDLVITDGENGIEGYNHSYHKVDGHKVNIADACGSGDTCISVLAVMKTLQYGLHESITLSNLAAAEVCCYPGVVPITRELLIKRCNEVNQR